MTIFSATGGASSRRVVVTDGAAAQDRSALAAVRALAGAGYAVTVAVSGRFSLAASSRCATGEVEVPPPGSTAYPGAIQALLNSGRYLGAVPASDRALQALEAPGTRLLDKAELAELAAAAGFPLLPSRRYADVDELLTAAEELAYPVVVKPTTSRFPAVRADGLAALQALQGRSGPVLVQPFLELPMRAVSGVVWEGQLVAACHQRYLRTWPVRAGTACAAETIAPDDQLEARLVRLLGDFDGIFQAQLIGEHLIDLNPRVYGSLPLAVAAGVNLPGLACDLVAGKRVTPVRARPGIAYRWLEGDLRHLAGQVASGGLRLRDAMSALRPRPGSAHSVASWRDPVPLATRARYALTVARDWRRDD